MDEECRADELRSLFLFEGLNDEQLAMLCAEDGWSRRSPGLPDVGTPLTRFGCLAAHVRLTTAADENVPVPGPPLVESGCFTRCRRQAPTGRHAAGTSASHGHGYGGLGPTELVAG
jgi:hypothetical protein